MIKPLMFLVGVVLELLLLRQLRAVERYFFFSSRRRHTRCGRDWSSDVCSSDLGWKAERTEENAKRMHDAGVELFNRFVVVMDHITGVGDLLRKTVDSYNKAIRSVDTRLWPKAEELQRLAGSGKELGALEQIEAV